MIVKSPKPPPDGAEVERIRKVRRGLERRFKTSDALWAHWMALDQKHRVQLAAKKKRTKKAPVLSGHKRAS